MENASVQLMRISQEHEEATMEQLRRLRNPFHDNINKEQALAGAIVELKRRADADASLRSEQDSQAATTGSKGPDWA
jgi:hypothetical protein